MRILNMYSEINLGAINFSNLIFEIFASKIINHHFFSVSKTAFKVVRNESKSWMNFVELTFRRSKIYRAFHFKGKYIPERQDVLKVIVLPSNICQVVFHGFQLCTKPCRMLDIEASGNNNAADSPVYRRCFEHCKLTPDNSIQIPYTLVFC